MRKDRALAETPSTNLLVDSSTFENRCGRFGR